MEDPVKHLLKISALGVTLLLWLVVMPVSTNAQMSKVKTLWVILMENHNWTGNNAGAAFGAPDIKGNPLAPYTNRTLLQTSAHAEQYFNPPGNHPSQPNYLWLEAGTNFGVLGDTQPGQPQIFTDQHLVKLLEDAGISWRAYAERSEEHTSELQSRLHLVCRLLLEKKKSPPICPDLRIPSGHDYSAHSNHFPLGPINKPSS